jgi:hypothetical protein
VTDQPIGWPHPFKIKVVCGVSDAPSNGSDSIHAEIARILRQLTFKDTTFVRIQLGTRGFVVEIRGYVRVTVNWVFLDPKLGFLTKEFAATPTGGDDISAYVHKQASPACGRPSSQTLCPLRLRKVVEELTYPCPSCGFLVFEEPAGSYNICPICNWEDDHVQLRHPLMGGGANRESLFESQQNIVKVVPAEVKEFRGHLRCLDWPPLGRADLGPALDAPETGVGYFNAAAAESPSYYWEQEEKPKGSI